MYRDKLTDTAFLHRFYYFPLSLSPCHGIKWSCYENRPDYASWTVKRHLSQKTMTAKVGNQELEVWLVSQCASFSATNFS